MSIYKNGKFSATALCLQSILWLPAIALLLGDINLTDNIAFYITLSVLAAGHSVAPLLLTHHDTLDAKKSVWKATVFISLVCLLLMSWARWGVGEEALSLSSALFILAVAYFAFNTWHFTLQNYGILGLIGRSHGTIPRDVRRIDRLFCYVHGLICVPLLWIPEKRHLSLLFEYLPSVFFEIPWATISTILVVAAFAVSAGLMLKQRFFFWERQAYSLGMALQVVVMAESNFLTSIILYFVPHWLAEVALVSRAIPKNRLSAKSLRTYLPYLFYLLLFINYAVARDYPVIRKWFSTGAVPKDMVVGQSYLMVLSMGAFFLIVFLHYTADRIVYRRDSPSLKAIIKKLN